MTGRRRLTLEQRRRQLVDVGAGLFATQSYEDVLMEDVAARAGVSRALLYKHFPSKRDLFAAVYQEASDRLVENTGFDPDVSFTDQVMAGLDVHFDYFAANRSAVIAANRTLAGDPAVQAIIVGELAAVRQVVLDGSGLDGHDREVLATVLTGWLVFVRSLVMDWLVAEALSREELRRISLGALVGALGELAERIERPAIEQPGI